MNTHALHRPLSLLLLFLALAASSIAAARASDFEWVDTPGKYAELFHDDLPVLRYMYAPLDTSTEQARYETYKVFHHLYAPWGSALLTNGPTGDAPYSTDVLYPHHRGLFYGFNKITYGDGKKADTWHMGHGESQQHTGLLESGADEDRGWRRDAIDWRGQDGEVFATEEREVSLALTERGVRVDFISTLRSANGETIHLDGDPQHAGFQFRAHDQVAKETAGETYYIRTDGKGASGETRNWDHKNDGAVTNEDCTNRPWNAMSFVVDGNRYTALYMDHPNNPKPARYSERDYGRFGSYFVHDLEPGEPLTVRYRLWVQDGDMDVETANRMHAEFIAANPPDAPLAVGSQDNADDASRPDNTPPEGFTALFNGEDLTGWKGLVENPKARAEMSPVELAKKQAEADKRMREHWKVENGALVFDGKGDSLCTDKDYGDFEMYVTWKIKPKGDSGIYVRGSPQIQIWDTENEEGLKHGVDKGSGALWNNEKHERFPLVKADKPVGEWNTFYIKMVGDKLTVKLNDQLVTDNVVMENYWERDKPIYPTGQIELQNHGNTLWFKNIYIRELD